MVMMMKISKCKKELARIISEHGGWRDGEFAAQDGDGGVGGYGVKPEWDSLAKYWWGEAFGEWFVANKIKNHHQTVLSREEYFHLYPAQDADGWIGWSGGECPVEDDAIIDIRFRDGHEERGVDADWDWEHSGGGDIIAYRLHKQEQAKSDYCESVTRSIPEPSDKPTIEQLASDYRNKLDYANRKQDEADKANMESDAALAQLEDAIAEIGFAITPLVAPEKEPELVIAVQVGDEVECVESNIKRNKYNGMVGRLHRIDESDTSTPYLVDFGGYAKIWCHEVKFISRT